MTLNACSRWVGAVLLACGAAVAAWAQAPGERPDFPTVALTDNTPGRLELSPHLAYLEDPGRKLSLDQASGPLQTWVGMDGTSPNFGFTDTAYWFRFALDNRTGKTQQRLLELPRAFIDDVRLFHLQDGLLLTKYALGDEQPFAQRVVQHQNFVMPLTVAPGVHQIYLRLASSGTIEAPLRLWEPAGRQAQEDL